MPTAFVSSSVLSFLFSSYSLYCTNGAACGAFFGCWCLPFCFKKFLGGWPMCQSSDVRVDDEYTVNALVVRRLDEVYVCVFSCFPAYLITYMCHVVYMCWCLCLCYIMVLASVCVPVGVEWEPQFLYGPICFVLFVLLINEIRGAACWDGPAAPLYWTGPLSHGLTLFSK